VNFSRPTKNAKYKDFQFEKPIQASTVPINESGTTEHRNG
jgi:hypothetical protein